MKIPGKGKQSGKSAQLLTTQLAPPTVDSMRELLNRAILDVMFQRSVDCTRGGLKNSVREKPNQFTGT